MTDLSWGAGKARLWHDEMPDWYSRDDYPETRTVIMHSLGSACSQPGPLLGLLGLELMIARGGRLEYGALGVRMDPTTRGTLDIEVVVTDPVGPAYTESIVQRSDYVQLGLPQEYVDAIVDGAVERLTQYAERVNISSGSLCFAKALHGRVGSSSRIFKILARSLCVMLFNPKVLDTDETVVELLHGEVVRQG